MEKLILSISTKSSNVDKAIEELETCGYLIQSMSIIMKEMEDIAQSYTQHLKMIDAVVGKRIGMHPITILGVENVVAGGPITSLIGVSALDETYKPEEAILEPIAGGFINAFMTVGINEEDAIFYMEGIAKGHVLFGLTVMMDKEEGALDIIEKHHLEHIVRIATN